MCSLPFVASLPSVDVEDRVEQTSPGRSQAVPTDLHLSHIYCGLRRAGFQLDAFTLCIIDSNPDTTEGST